MRLELLYLWEEKKPWAYLGKLDSDAPSYLRGDVYHVRQLTPKLVRVVGWDTEAQ